MGPTEKENPSTRRAKTRGSPQPIEGTNKTERVNVMRFSLLGYNEKRRKSRQC